MFYAQLFITHLLLKQYPLLGHIVIKPPTPAQGWYNKHTPWGKPLGGWTITKQTRFQNRSTNHRHNMRLSELECSHEHNLPRSCREAGALTSGSKLTAPDVAPSNKLILEDAGWTKQVERRERDSEMHTLCVGERRVYKCEKMRGYEKMRATCRVVHQTVTSRALGTIERTLLICFDVDYFASYRKEFLGHGRGMVKIIRHEEQCQACGYFLFICLYLFFCYLKWQWNREMWKISLICWEYLMMEKRLFKLCKIFANAAKKNDDDQNSQEFQFKETMLWGW